MNARLLRPARTGRPVIFPSITRHLVAVSLWMLTASFCLGQGAPKPDPYKELSDRLHSLTRIQLSGCRWHADVAHPEDPTLDDSNWNTIDLGANFVSGV